MIRRCWLLLQKEVAQHVRVLLAMTIALLLLMGIRWLSTLTQERALSEMEAAQPVILLFVPIAGLVLGHTVVVREYQGRTQLFLESLPLLRWEVVLVKYLFALGVLLGLSWFALALIALAAHEHSGRFLFIAGLRSFGYVAACWSLFFCLGFLGRMRVLAYITLALGAIALNTLTSFEFERFGPFALIESTAFSYDRTRIPWRALAESLGCSGGLLGLSFVLGLVAEGSLAEVLSRRASSREVTAVTAIVFAEIFAVSWAAGKRPTPPFEFSSAQVVEDKPGKVAVMYGFPALEPVARALLPQFAALRARMQSELVLGEWPALRVAQDSLLTGNRVHPRHASPDTVMLEANLGARDFAVEVLLENVAHAALVRASDGRAAFEPNHWLLDGFSSVLGIETAGKKGELQWLRAAVAARHLELNAKTVSEWEHVMERVGEVQATALAFALVDFLRNRHGLAKTRELARFTLVKDGTQSLLGGLGVGDDGRAFQDFVAESLPAFVAAFATELRRRAAEPALAPKLEQIPKDTATVEVRSGKLGPELHYAVSGRALDRERDCKLLHALLRPYDIFYPTEELTPKDLRVERGATVGAAVLRGQYAAGQRVYAAVECEVPEIQARERLIVARIGQP